MKWYGMIGFSETVNTKPGVWAPKIIERPYCGDIISLRRRTQVSDVINDNISIDNTLSILSDDYCTQKYSSIKYAEVMGSKWKVSNVEIAYPRLLLTLGGLYNAESD